MIYTRKQLDEVIEAAEKEGWRPTKPMPGDIAYRGYPLTKRECAYPYTQRDGQWRVSMTDGVRVELVAVSAWVVEPIARLCQEPKREEPKSTYWVDRLVRQWADSHEDWVDRLVLSRCAAGPWKAWPETPARKDHDLLVRGPAFGVSIGQLREPKDGQRFWRVMKSDGGANDWVTVTHFAELGEDP